MRSHLLKAHLVAAAFIAACGISQSKTRSDEIVGTNQASAATRLREESIAPPRIKDYHGVLRAMRCSDLEAATIQNERASLPDEWARNWAGVYTDCSHSTAHTELYLLPETGVILYNQGCFEVSYWAGRVSGTFPDGVRTRFDFTTHSENSSPVSSDWYFVECDGQRCSLRLEEMIQLVHAFNFTPTSEFEEMEQQGTIAFRLQELGKGESKDRRKIQGTPNFPEVFSGLLVREPLVVRVRSIDPDERLWKTSNPDPSNLRQFTVHLDVLEGTLATGRRFTFPGSGPWTVGIFTVQSVSEDSKRVSGILEIVDAIYARDTPPRIGTILRYPGSPPK